MGCSNSTMQTAITPRNIPTLQREKTGFVAFEIDLTNDKTKELNKNIDEILSRPLPLKRLQTLESLDRIPKLTAEELQRKLFLADEKRQKTMDRKTEFSRRSSLRRQSVIKNDTGVPTERISRFEGIEVQSRIEISNKEKQKNKILMTKEEMRKNKEIFDDYKESTDEESWQETGKKLKALPPINKSKLEVGMDSSGYSSRNISATQDCEREDIPKINLQKAESFENDYVINKSKIRKNPLTIIDNFYDNELSQESDMDSNVSTHVKFQIN